MYFMVNFQNDFFRLDTGHSQSTKPLHKTHARVQDISAGSEEQSVLDMMAGSVEGLLGINLNSPASLNLLKGLIAKHKELTNRAEIDFATVFNDEEMETILQYKRSLNQKQEAETFTLKAEDYAKAALVNILSITNPDLVIETRDLRSNEKATRAVLFLEKAFALDKNSQNLDRICTEVPLLGLLKNNW